MFRDVQCQMFNLICDIHVKQTYSIYSISFKLNVYYVLNHRINPGGYAEKKKKKYISIS